MTLTPGAQEQKVEIVGSSVFGRYQTINAQRTYNMYISDGWLNNFPGYAEKRILTLLQTEGRGLFHSIRGNFLVSIVGPVVFRINPNLGIRALGILESDSGEVIMDENLSSQICLVDGLKGYIYNWSTEGFGEIVFSPSSPDFTPNYVTYQNTYFIFGNANRTTTGSQWYIYESGFNPSTLADPLQLNFVQTLALQTKPDFALAAIRIPSHGNYLLVLGSSVGEIWNQVGGAQVYQRNSSINIDYGVASVSTIAASDDMVAWLGINEKSTPALMVMQGGQAKRISTDGIDELLSTVKHPDQSTAIFYRIAGHVFYILTFFHEEDDFSIMYDFTTGKFFDLTDWNFSCYPARQIVYFNNKVYFISIKRGSLMEINTAYNYIAPDSVNVYEIPFIRTTNTIRLPGAKRFIASNLTFTIENGVEEDVYFDAECDGRILGEVSSDQMYAEDGVTPLLTEGGICQIYEPRFDLTISKNGGITFGKAVSYFMHGTGHYNNQPRFNQLGQANVLTFQIRFWGFYRIAAYDAILEIRE
ncbi:MAG TPA: hypothetical protein VLB84_03630 [Bacteroidia bacterium]|nr:hypothetical protein [Bacteroidia bacterium]